MNENEISTQDKINIILDFITAYINENNKGKLVAVTDFMWDYFRQLRGNNEND